MTNEENYNKELEKAKHFISDNMFAAMMFDKYGFEKSEPENWSYDDWDEWEKSKLEELIAEEERKLIEESGIEFLKWELIELGKENYDGTPFQSEALRNLHIRERLEGIQKRGYKIHPESLTPNRYGEGYIILVSTTQETEKNADKIIWDIRMHLNEKKSEFKKEISRARTIIRNEKIRKTEEERNSKIEDSMKKRGGKPFKTSLMMGENKKKK